MNQTLNKPDGIVYVLSNRGFWLPEKKKEKTLVTGKDLIPIIKIGHTKPATVERLRARMGELFSTGVPVPFDLEYAKAVANSQNVENRLHKAFVKNRVNKTREFFHVTVESVVAVLELADGMEIKLNDEVTQPEVVTRERVKLVTKQQKLSFEHMDILPGAELTSVADSSITATVVNDTQVRFAGDLMTPGAAATKIYSERSGKKGHKNAFYTWKYRGELLLNICRRADGTTTGEGKVTKSDIAARDRLESVASKTKLSFEVLRIPKGATLVSVTNPSKTAEVVNDTDVKYQGEDMSASAAATKIHHATHTSKIYRSAFHSWKYNGKTLQKIRKQIESEAGA